MSLKNWLCVAVAVALSAVGASEAEVDVYAIRNPTNALQALRAKWRGVESRVSMWKMPDLTRKFLEIDGTQQWWEKDKKNRYYPFSTACLNAIGMRIEPPVWFYNLACARAVNGQHEEAVEALEKAVAAGYGSEDGQVEHVKSDEDLVSITNDFRFAKLCTMMGADDRPSFRAPQKMLEEANGVARLTNDNVYYALGEESYWVELVTTNLCPVVYVNHHVNHPDVPCENVIQAVYPHEAHEAKRDIGPANIHFTHVFMSRMRGTEYCCPAIVASDWTDGVDPLNRATSTPARLGVGLQNASLELKHEFWNVLGIYSVGDDYGKDGVDRFMGYYPGCIAYMGDAAEADKFVKLAADAIHAMPPKFRGQAASILPSLIRYGQKCVQSEKDFMSGMAQRPAIRFADIDTERVLVLARELSERKLPPPSPFFDRKKCRIAHDAISVTDFWNAPYEFRRPQAVSARHFACLARPGNYTYKVDVRICPAQRGKLAWKVLQGDSDKIRIKSSEDGFAVDIEVDYHSAFDVALPDGRKVRSSRVDIGCFLVDDGVASMPSIVSVYFMPNETREYAEDGKLVSIDYTKPQYTNYCPRLCPKGTWKDVMHWNADGRLTGWTRINHDYRGFVETNEFTREGFVIDARDDLGRPLEVHENIQSTWLQRVDSTNLTNEALLQEMGWRGQLYDQEEAHPRITTLSWRYMYKDGMDAFGEPYPNRPLGFFYRPTLCTRADFADSSAGFRLPLVDQMELGYNLFAGLRHGLVGTDIMDFVRSDSVYALKVEGLTPPKVLKKMKFCPWTPSTSDAWRVSLDRFEARHSSCLAELADGVYRQREKIPSYNDQGYDGYSYKSVNETYRTMNCLAEKEAYELLDREYRRCKEAEIRRLLSSLVDEEGWNGIQICEGKPYASEDIPKEKEHTVACWQITEEMCFGILAAQRLPKGPRKYFFRKIDKATGKPQSYDFFRELPSRAIGNTFISASDGDSNAINNYAVLLYAGVANPNDYEDDEVIELLECAAKAGNATALYNLGVLHENRGEMSDAARRYDEARVQNELSGKNVGVKP